MRIFSRPAATVAAATFLVSVATIASAAPSSANASAGMDNLSGYTSLGSVFAQNMRLAELNWTAPEFEAFMAGVRAVYNGQAHPDEAAARKVFAEMQRRIGKSPEKNDASESDSGDKLATFMKLVREHFNLLESDTGLLYRITLQGAGPRPRPEDTILVTFTALAPDAKTEITDLSRKELRVKVSDLLPGLAEGMQRIAVGGNAMLVVPPKLSFGDGKWPDSIEPGMPIIYRVELLDIAPASGTSP